MATLHNLLSNYRDQGVRNRENVHEWKVDGFLVDWRLSAHPSSAPPGVHFDVPAFYPLGHANNIGREAAAAFWPTIKRQQVIDTIGYPKKRAVWVVLHEAGHTLGFYHGWSSCHREEGGECSEGTIMSYTPVESNAIRFNTEASYTANRHVPAFYNLAPESWAKPGRYGFPVFGLPPSTRYIVKYKTY